MSEPGFRVTVRLDPETGIVSGGSRSNCGTWMDKMGESARAGNRGVPATPRDGAAVEIVGLVKSAVRWLSSLAAEGSFATDGVVLADGTPLSYSAWDAALQAAFEPAFWVPLDPSEDAAFGCDSALVHRRGVYRDTVGSAEPYCDYQLRPNACIAMVVAPELFTRDRAWAALEMTRQLLRGGLGMRTLDPGDLQYRPDYHNQDDSSEYATARGFNYHQGPEWLWQGLAAAPTPPASPHPHRRPLGFFIRARLLFAPDPAAEAAAAVAELEHHAQHIDASQWAGLPEICNADGAECRDGCATPPRWPSAPRQLTRRRPDAGVVGQLPPRGARRLQPRATLIMNWLHTCQKLVHGVCRALCASPSPGEHAVKVGRGVGSRRSGRRLKRGW